eukprot:IDg13805t1
MSASRGYLRAATTRVHRAHSEIINGGKRIAPPCQRGAQSNTGSPLTASKKLLSGVASGYAGRQQAVAAAFSALTDEIRGRCHDSPRSHCDHGHRDDAAAVHALRATRSPHRTRAALWYATAAFRTAE